eukprot:jgi/Botrbrau1/13779/Bobra.0056s0031.1
MALGEGKQTEQQARSQYSLASALEVGSPSNDGIALLGDERPGSREWDLPRRQYSESRGRQGCLVISLVCCSLALVMTTGVALYSSWQLYSTEFLLEPTVRDLKAPLTLYDAQDLLQRNSPILLVDVSREACGGTGTWYRQDASCSCFQCYTGPNCQTAIPLSNCSFNAESGTPLLFEEYWVAHPEAELRIPASEHLGYMDKPILPRLEAAIRAMHAMVGNIETKGKYIVVGLGSSQVIMAALYALSEPDAGVAMVYAARPYYSAYQLQSDIVHSQLFKWWNATEAPDPQMNPVIELVTSPNNPDGYIRSPTLQGARVLRDHAYLWPHFTPIVEKASYGPTEVATFTLSKLTGHAGSRMGWAVVEDAGVAERMMEFIGYTTNFAFDSQYRAAVMLEHVLATNGSIIEFARQHMASRWQRIREAFEYSTRFAVLAPEEAGRPMPGNDNMAVSPPYLWLQCLDSERDHDCYEALKAGGVLGRPGSAFGMEPSYVRVELLMRAKEFDLLIQKLYLLAGS